MERNHILIIVAVLLLILFFWPKTNSREDDFFTAEIRGDSHYQNMACTCIGLTVSQNNCKSCTQYTDCYGVPVSCHFGCQGKINGTWQPTYCSNGTAVPSIPADNASCTAQGGTWGPIGLSPEYVCVLPTTDSGKTCFDSSECQGACVAELNSLEYEILSKYHIPIRTNGKCTSSTSGVGCNAYVENGLVTGVLCVD